LLESEEGKGSRFIVKIPGLIAPQNSSPQRSPATVS
jgi:hypothetical protein